MPPCRHFRACAQAAQRADARTGARMPRQAHRQPADARLRQRRRSCRMFSDVACRRTSRANALQVEWQSPPLSPAFAICSVISPRRLFSSVPPSRRSIDGRRFHSPASSDFPPLRAAFRDAAPRLIYFAPRRHFFAAALRLPPARERRARHSTATRRQQRQRPPRASPCKRRCRATSAARQQRGASIADICAAAPRAPLRDGAAAYAARRCCRRCAR